MPFEGLLLGLSMGTYCITACAPVALPLFFAEEAGGSLARVIRSNAARLGLFLAGRLLAYIAVGFFLGAAGAYAAGYVDPAVSRIGLRLASFFSGLLLVVAGIARSSAKGRLCELARRVFKPETGAFTAGLATGLSICPPFFAAAARVFGGAARGAFEGAAFFAFFFVGTTIWFLPLLGVPFATRKAPILTMIARSAMLLLGVYYAIAVGLIGAV